MIARGKPQFGAVVLLGFWVIQSSHAATDDWTSRVNATWQQSLSTVRWLSCLDHAAASLDNRGVEVSVLAAGVADRCVKEYWWSSKLATDDMNPAAARWYISTAGTRQIGQATIAIQRERAGQLPR